MVNTKNFKKSIEKLGWEVSDVDGKCGNNLAVKKHSPCWVPCGSMWHAQVPKNPRLHQLNCQPANNGEPSPPLHPLVSKTSSKNSFIVPSGESGYLT